MALLGGLIHVFNIIETERRKKFTIYKIQMISFPKNYLSCLTKQTIYKRYSDFRRLENDLSKNYKSYNLKTFFKSDNAFFKRYKKNIWVTIMEASFIKYVLDLTRKWWNSVKRTFSISFTTALRIQ